MRDKFWISLISFILSLSLIIQPLYASAGPEEGRALQKSSSLNDPQFREDVRFASGLPPGVIRSALSLKEVRRGGKWAGYMLAAAAAGLGIFAARPGGVTSTPDVSFLRPAELGPQGEVEAPITQANAASEGETIGTISDIADVIRDVVEDPGDASPENISFEEIGRKIREESAVIHNALSELGIDIGENELACVFTSLLWQESRFRQFDRPGHTIVSSKGAVGMAQISGGRNGVLREIAHLLGGAVRNVAANPNTAEAVAAAKRDPKKYGYLTVKEIVKVNDYGINIIRFINEVLFDGELTGDIEEWEDNVRVWIAEKKGRRIGDAALRRRLGGLEEEIYGRLKRKFDVRDSAEDNLKTGYAYFALLIYRIAYIRDENGLTLLERSPEFPYFESALWAYNAGYPAVRSRIGKAGRLPFTDEDINERVIEPIMGFYARLIRDIPQIGRENTVEKIIFDYKGRPAAFKIKGRKKRIALEKTNMDIARAIGGLKEQCADYGGILDAIAVQAGRLAVYRFSEVHGDLMGFAYYSSKGGGESDFVALNGRIMYDSIAVFHETCEYLIRKGDMRLNLPGGNVLEIVINGKTAGGVIAVSDAARRYIQKAQQEPAMRNHYLLRALQRTLFAAGDSYLSENIKKAVQETHPENSGRAVSRRRVLTGMAAASALLGAGLWKIMESKPHPPSVDNDKSYEAEILKEMENLVSGIKDPRFRRYAELSLAKYRENGRVLNTPGGGISLRREGQFTDVAVYDGEADSLTVNYQFFKLYPALILQSVLIHEGRHIADRESVYEQKSRELARLGTIFPFDKDGRLLKIPGTDTDAYKALLLYFYVVAHMEEPAYAVQYEFLAGRLGTGLADYLSRFEVNPYYLDVAEDMSRAAAQGQVTQMIQAIEEHNIPIGEIRKHEQYKILKDLMSDLYRFAVNPDGGINHRRLREAVVMQFRGAGEDKKSLWASMMRVEAKVFGNVQTGRLGGRAGFKVTRPDRFLQWLNDDGLLNVPVSLPERRHWIYPVPPGGSAKSGGSSALTGAGEGRAERLEKLMQYGRSAGREFYEKVSMLSGLIEERNTDSSVMAQAGDAVSGDTTASSMLWHAVPGKRLGSGGKVIYSLKQLLRAMDIQEIRELSERTKGSVYFYAGGNYIPDPKFRFLRKSTVTADSISSLINGGVSVWMLSTDELAGLGVDKSVFGKMEGGRFVLPVCGQKGAETNILLGLEIVRNKGYIRDMLPFFKLILMDIVKSYLIIEKGEDPSPEKIRQILDIPFPEIDAGATERINDSYKHIKDIITSA